MDIKTPRVQLNTIYRHMFVDPERTTKIQTMPVRTALVITDMELQEEGVHEQVVKEAAKLASDKHLVNELIKKSNRCIISISTHFPWTLLPNTISVEESRIVITFRQFFAKQSHGIDIKDISNVLIESSPFFATLRFISRTYIENEITVGYLNTTKAVEVLMVIEGLRIFAQNNIDTSVYEVNELISKTKEFHKEQIQTG